MVEERHPSGTYYSNVGTLSEPALNALKLLQMFHASCDEPVNGIEAASLGLAVEATEFPLVYTVRSNYRK